MCRCYQRRAAHSNTGYPPLLRSQDPQGSRHCEAIPSGRTRCPGVGLLAARSGFHKTHHQTRNVLPFVARL